MPTKRILILGAPSQSSSTLSLISDLTGSAPTPDINNSTAGLTHSWHVQTPYYTAHIPVWVDEVPDFSVWKMDFLRPEAQEVVEAVGAWVYCFSPGVDAEVGMRAIQEVVEKHSEAYVEGTMLAVGMGNVREGEWEDRCMDCGFEFVEYAAKGKNEFGEKRGFARVKEALEANEWAAKGGEEDGELDCDDDFVFDEAEMTAELFGMKAALIGGDEEDEEEKEYTGQRQAGQVDDLNRMMGKLLAIKEQSAELPEHQRKRLAAKAVREIMEENPNM